MAWVFSPVVLEALECFQGNLIWAFLSRLHLTHHNVVPPQPFVVQKALRIKPIKIPIKSNCFLFLKVKLCFSRLNRTQTWTLERKLTRQETHLLGAIVCCPLRFHPRLPWFGQFCPEGFTTLWKAKRSPLRLWGKKPWPPRERGGAVSVISALGRLKKWDLWVQNHPGLHSKLQVDLAPN